MDPISQQLESIYQSRISGGPALLDKYKSSLGTAAQQDQQSIDQSRSIYSNPGNFEHSQIGALGLGLLQPTSSGRFSEGMFNGLAAAMDAKNYNQQANLTRQDGIDFLKLAPEVGIVTQTTRYPLREANQALADLRAGKFEGAAVLVP